MTNNKVPAPTIARLFTYYRALLESRETEYISSEELAELSGNNAPQVRKDITYFGEFGTPGKGYEVQKLSHRIKGILGIDKEWEVVLIGVGNLGQALLTYDGLKSQGFKISQLFDSNPAKIGNSCAGLKIKDITDIKESLQISPVNIAIIAVPSNAAQGVVDLLVQSDIKAILNFAPKKIFVPPDVKVFNIDIVNELTGLSYYLTHPVFRNAEDDGSLVETSAEPILAWL